MKDDSCTGAKVEKKNPSTKSYKILEDERKLNGLDRKRWKIKRGEVDWERARV